MNTIFFQKASGNGINISWKDIFSDVTKKHRSDQRNELLTKGVGSNVPSPDRMLEEWQKPWLFARVFLWGVVLSVAVWISLMIFPSVPMIVVFCVIPAFVVPLAVLIFYWELDVPGNISIYETMFLMLIGGLLSLTVTGIVRVMFSEASDIAFLVGPFPEELAKCLVVTLILSRKKYTYGLQGIVVGGAVGVGFSAIESAGYALNTLFESFAITGSISIGETLNTLLIRGILAIGGHVVWAALYGGAIALIKGKGKMGLHVFTNSLFWMTFSAAFLFHTLWNFSVYYVQYSLSRSMVMFLYYMEVYYIKYILLIVLAWYLMFYIIKKCLRQIVRVDQMYQYAARH